MMFFSPLIYLSSSKDSEATALERIEQNRISEEDTKVMDKKHSALRKFIQVVANEHKISKLQATKLIKTRKDLLQKTANEINVRTEVLLPVLDNYIRAYEKGTIEIEQKEKELNKLRT
jgi:hypothetical protein